MPEFIITCAQCGNEVDRTDGTLWPVDLVCDVCEPEEFEASVERRAGR